MGPDAMILVFWMLSFKPTFHSPISLSSRGLDTTELNWTELYQVEGGSSQPRDLTQLSCIAGGFFTTWATRKAPNIYSYIYQFSSAAQLCPTLCNHVDCSTPGLAVHHQVSEFTLTHAHWVGDDIQPSHPLLSPSPPAFKLSQHQGLFKWVSSSYQVARVLEFQLHHQSFQWIFRTDFL